jgi:ribose/xylose/arabinose/galactoside ABC-type transport system permease subunit
MSTTIASPSLRRRLSVPLAGPILIVYLILGGMFVPHFLGTTNITSILFSVAALLPAVLGMQLLLVLGRFDLSIGGTASLSGMLAGLILMRYGSVSLAICLGLMVGATVGGIAGYVISHFRVDPLIATLALLGVVRSLALVANDGRIVAGLPDRFGWIADARVATIPVLIVLSIFLVVGAAAATRHLVIFRRFYAAGNNPAAAAHAGLNVPGLLILGYVLAGVGAALTGLIQASRTLSSSPLLFDSLAIEAITACIIGGGSLSGGRGGMFGAAVGLLVVSATDNLVIMLGISVYWQSLAVGVLLLIAVLGSPMAEEVRNRLVNLFSSLKQ